MLSRREIHSDRFLARFDLERDVLECRVDESQWKEIVAGCFKEGAERGGYHFACSVNGSGTAVTIV